MMLICSVKPFLLFSVEIIEPVTLQTQDASVWTPEFSWHRHHEGTASGSHFALRHITGGKKTWFMSRVVNEWNKLSRYIVATNMIKSLEWRLDIFMNREGSWWITNSQKLPGVGYLATCSLLIPLCILVYDWCCEGFWGTCCKHYSGIWWER